MSARTKVPAILAAAVLSSIALTGCAAGDGGTGGSAKLEMQTGLGSAGPTRMRMPNRVKKQCCADPPSGAPRRARPGAD